ncbi:MAG: hypothetical protein ACTHKT_03915 [Solirubrobacterales bacterium]
MKHSKSLGLTVAAALTLMAFLGAGSASATVLCKAAEKEGCGASGQDYNAKTIIKAAFEEGTGVTFRVSGETISACVESEYEAETANTGGVGAVTGSVKKFTLGICTPIEIHVVETGKFEITWQNGSVNGNFIGTGYKISMVIGGGNCTYGPSAEPMGTLTGGAMGTIDVHTTLNKKEGGVLCPTTMVMEAAYTVTSPAPLYVSKN